MPGRRSRGRSPLAIILNIVVIALALWISAPLRHAPMPRVETRWYDLVLRAGMVALLVGIVVTLSFRIGPTASGNLVVFPIVLSSIIIIFHHRVGGPATAAIMANAVIGLGGFGFAVLALCSHRRTVGLIARADFGTACFRVRQSADLFRAPAFGLTMTATLADPSLWYGLALKIAMTAVDRGRRFGGGRAQRTFRWIADRRAADRRRRRHDYSRARAFGAVHIAECGGQPDCQRGLRVVRAELRGAGAKARFAAEPWRRVSGLACHRVRCCGWWIGAQRAQSY